MRKHMIAFDGERRMLPSGCGSIGVERTTTDAAPIALRAVSILAESLHLGLAFWALHAI
jgi:hypothetical protein